MEDPHYNATGAALLAAQGVDIDEDYRYACVSTFELYVTSMYWALMLITGIGGASLESSKYSTAEKLV